MANKVKCRKFQCYTMSIAQLFGRTPKVEFICGECRKYNAKRAYTANCYNGVELACDSCGTLNELPICMR